MFQEILALKTDLARNARRDSPSSPAKYLIGGERDRMPVEAPWGVCKVSIQASAGGLKVGMLQEVAQCAGWIIHAAEVNKRAALWVVCSGEQRGRGFEREKWKEGRLRLCRTEQKREEAETSQSEDKIERKGMT